MKLLLLLNGHQDKLFEAHSLDKQEFIVKKMDEKLLASLRKIIGIMKETKYKKVLFGCIELDLQRFQTFMKLFIFLSGINSGGIIDELGNSNKYSFLKLIFVEVPLLILEAIASVFIVFYYYIKLPVLKWTYQKRS